MKTPKCYTWPESCGSHLSGGVKEKIFFCILQRADFLWRSAQIFSFILRSCHILFTSAMKQRWCCRGFVQWSKYYWCWAAYGSEQAKQSTVWHTVSYFETYFVETSSLSIVTYHRQKMVVTRMKLPLDRMTHIPSSIMKSTIDVVATSSLSIVTYHRRKMVVTRMKLPLAFMTHIPRSIMKSTIDVVETSSLSIVTYHPQKMVVTRMKLPSAHMTHIPSSNFIIEPQWWNLPYKHNSNPPCTLHSNPSYTIIVTHHTRSIVIHHTRSIVTHHTRSIVHCC